MPLLTGAEDIPDRFNWQNAEHRILEVTTAGAPTPGRGNPTRPLGAHTYLLTIVYTGVSVSATKSNENTVSSWRIAG